MIVDPKTKAKQLEYKVLEINVPPNSFLGKSFVFSEEGDQNTNSIPADIIFVLSDKPHQNFSRKENDIEYCLIFTRSEAKREINQAIPSLDGKELKVCKKSIQPDSIVRFNGEGLPFENGKRGDLIVRFDIIDDQFKGKIVNANIIN